MASEDIFIPGKFTDLTDKQQLFLLNELLIQMLNRLNQVDPGDLLLSTLEGHDAGHTIQSQGVGNAPTWEENVLLTSLTLSGLTASQPVVTNAAKLLTSVAWTGVGSFRDTLGLETIDSPNFTGLTIGVGGAGVDYTLNFNGETNDGTLTWMEDEDYFSFNDDIMVPTNERIYFVDTGSSIRGDAVPALNLTDDTQISLYTPVTKFGRDLDEDVYLDFLGTTNDGQIRWMEDEDYFQFQDDILVIQDEYIYFGDTGSNIRYSSGGGSLEISDNSHIHLSTGQVDIGLGAHSDTYIYLHGDHSTGELRWQEDEQILYLVNNLLVGGSENILGTLYMNYKAFVFGANDSFGVGYRTVKIENA